MRTRLGTLALRSVVLASAVSMAAVVPASAATGSLTWAPTTRILASIKKAYDPVTGALPSGGLVVARTTGQVNKAYATTYSSATSSWSAPVLISGTDDTTIVSLDTNATGKAIAVWAVTSKNLKTHSIRAAMLTGGAWSAPTTIGTGSNGAIPVATMDDAGNTIVVWGNQTTNYPKIAKSNIMAVRYDAASGVWATPVTIAVGDASAPVQVVGNGSGAVVAIWGTVAPKKNFGSTSFQFSRFAAGSWSTAAPVLATGTGVSPSPAMDEAGAVVLAFQGLAGKSSLVQATSLPAGSSSWNSPVTIATVKNLLDPPSLAINGAGDAVVTFGGLVKDINKASVARYTKASGTWSAAVSLDTGNKGATEALPVITSDGSAYALLGRGPQSIDGAGTDCAKATMLAFGSAPGSATWAATAAPAGAKGSCFASVSALPTNSVLAAWGQGVSSISAALGN